MSKRTRKNSTAEEKAPAADEAKAPVTKKAKKDDAKAATPASTSGGDSIYQHTLKDWSGKDVSLKDYEGKVLLITNIAANCGHTQKNMSMFERLQTKYKDQGFEILAFPSNEFGKQRGNIEACSTKYKANYKIFEEVKVNDASSPLFVQLRKATGTDAVAWNFGKFLVDRKGVPIKHIGSSAVPKKEQELVAEIEAALAAK